MRKISKAEIQNRIYEIFGCDYVIIGNTFGMDKDITICHKKCGNIWKQKPSNFLKSVGCKVCNKKKQYNKLQ